MLDPPSKGYSSRRPPPLSRSPPHADNLHREPESATQDGTQFEDASFSNPAQDIRMDENTITIQVKCPIKACERCHGIKSRCSLEWPTCARCKKAKAECVYRETKNGADFMHLFMQRINQLGSRVQQLEKHFAEEKRDAEKRLVSYVAREKVKVLTHQGLILPLNWRIFITPEGFSIQTDLRNVSDLLYFVSRQANHTSRIPNDGRFLSTQHRGSAPQTVRCINFSRYYGLFSVMKSKRFVKQRLLLPEAQGPTLQSTMDRLMRMFFDCSFLYKEIDTVKFLNQYREGKLPLFLVWSIVAWMGKHAYYQHKIAGREYLLGIADHAYKKSKQLLEESFDDPSVYSIVAHNLLFYYSLFDGEQPSLLTMARQQVNALKSSHYLDTADEFEAERFRRAAWSVCSLEYARAIFSMKLTKLDDLLPGDEPRPFPHEKEEVAACLSCQTHSLRGLKQLMEIIQQRASYPTESDFLNDILRRNAIHEKNRPPTLRLELLNTPSFPPYILRYVAQYETGYRAVHIQLFSGIFLQATEKNEISHREKWSREKHHSFRVCIECANVIINILALVVQFREFCLVPEFIDCLVVAFKVHMRLFIQSPLDRPWIWHYFERAWMVVRTFRMLELPQSEKLYKDLESAMSKAGLAIPGQEENGIPSNEELEKDQPDQMVKEKENPCYGKIQFCYVPTEE
ncbi:uncharacterized protein VTP21DRAFT_1160 [Calcarisporiella thermophila]|uniref:uncharacterized protein n=1 Tax=Calcarisporiella thermophila TaxID=911321 RepID=UPI0037446C26